jgi:uncharacterized membrane protein YdjX (TVP38/TMEM64 family)
MIQPHRKIHAIIRKHHSEGARKAGRIFSFRYPKLMLLAFFIVLAYILFSSNLLSGWIDSFYHLGAFGVFISGAMTAFGFTAPFGIGLLSKMNPSNILFATLIAGIGATLADLLIFHTIKFSFADELNKLEETKAIKEIEKITEKHKHVKIVHYLLYLFAGIIIISPLPDEVGVSMLAGLTTINPIKFITIAFCLHNLAIFSFLSLI